LVAVAGVLTAVGIAVVVLIAAGSGGVETNLGVDEFSAGRTDAIANAIEREGPIAYPDLLGRDRPIYIHHLGTDLDEGWLAIDAVAPGQPADCVLEWDGRRFADPCREATYAPTDPDLGTYPTRVEDDRLLVDLRGG
jgi:hypothetical protein